MILEILFTFALIALAILAPMWFYAWRRASPQFYVDQFFKANRLRLIFGAILAALVTYTLYSPYAWAEWAEFVGTRILYGLAICGLAVTVFRGKK